MHLLLINSALQSFFRKSIISENLVSFSFIKFSLLNSFSSWPSLIVELKDIEEDGMIVDTLARWKVDYRITLRELAFLKRAIEAEMVRRNQNV